jgi:hypothetical protein
LKILKVGYTAVTIQQAKRQETLTRIVCLIALGIQQAKRQETALQAKPPKTTTRCGCSLGAAGTERRTKV